MQIKNAVLSIFIVSVAADATTDILTQVPTCALSCLLTGAGKVGCPITDYACQCEHAAELQNAAGPCIESACSTADAASTYT
jgi:hypothetical protein